MASARREIKTATRPRGVKKPGQSGTHRSSYATWNSTRSPSSSAEDRDRGPRTKSERGVSSACEPRDQRPRVGLAGAVGEAHRALERRGRLGLCARTVAVRGEAARELELRDDRIGGEKHRLAEETLARDRVAAEQ